MDIQKEKPEFNETIKLVEAVLERLTFHAFEEVLIWSNEHASRALNLCLKKTLKEFESGDLILTSGYPTLKHFSVDSIIKALSTALDQAQDYQCNLNKEIDRLENQLSKTQVPEDFVLVPRELSDEKADAQALLAWGCHAGLFKSQNRDMSALQVEEFRLKWCKGKARELQEEYRFTIKAQEQGHD